MQSSILGATKNTKASQMLPSVSSVAVDHQLGKGEVPCAEGGLHLTGGAVIRRRTLVTGSNMEDEV